MNLVYLERSNRVIEKYARGFGPSGKPLPAIHLLTHKIKVSTEKPIKMKQYHYLLKLKKQLQKKQINLWKVIS
jgi:hypothetical protein